MNPYCSRELIRPAGLDVAFLRDLPALPRRAQNAHKGSFGLALVVGGSRGMSGAVALAGSAALVAGAGLVRLLVPETIGNIVAGFEKEYMTVYAPCDSDGRLNARARECIATHAVGAAALAVGPGLGRSAELDRLVADLYRGVDKPMVFDADALNALSPAFTPGTYREGPTHDGPRILTPHPGEFARLTGEQTPVDSTGRIEAAKAFVQKYRNRNDRVADTVLVLKGAETVVSDGRRAFVNHTGNAGLATGGTGDVLTGIITALLAQKMEPLAAARLGVALHGLAADCAAELLPLESICATTVVQFFPMALRLLRSETR